MNDDPHEWHFFLYSHEVIELCYYMYECVMCVYVNKQLPSSTHVAVLLCGECESHAGVRGRAPNRERSPHLRHAHRERR